MARRERNELDLPKLDELFTTQDERDEARLKKIYDVSLDKIDVFPDHDLEAKEPDHIAVKYYKAYHSGSAKTLKSIQITLAARLEK